MNTVNQNELFVQVSEFLKKKGIELQEGSYTRTIQKGCQVLADTINLSQQAVHRAKVEVEKKFSQVRQSIHERTAAKSPTAAAASSTPPAPEPAPASAEPVPAKPKRRVSRKPQPTKRSSRNRPHR